MDINIQRELDNINSILSFSNQEKKTYKIKQVPISIHKLIISTQIKNNNFLQESIIS